MRSSRGVLLLLCSLVPCAAVHAVHARQPLVVGACGGSSCPASTASPYPNVTSGVYAGSSPVLTDITFSQLNNVVGSAPTMLAVAYVAYASIKAQFPSAWPSNRWITSVYVGCNLAITEGA